MKPKTPANIRFWKHVLKTKKCWIWTSAFDRDGYARFFNNGSKSAHRFSYELHKGKIQKGLTVDHLCRNRGCVNPEHMELVTIKVNSLRGNSPTAKNSRKTKCKRGHMFTKENTYITTTKYGHSRQCRECVRQHQRRYAALSRAKDFKEEK